MIAEVAHDLQQALLARGGLGAPRRLPPQQALPRQAQEAVVLRRRPGQKTLLGQLGQMLVLARPRPVQNQGRMTLMAKSVARDSPSNGCGFGQARRLETPVPGPEIILRRLQAGQQGLRQRDGRPARS